MFGGQGLQELVEMFEKRGVSLFHACQFLDFESYLKIGGIPSRELMTKSGLVLTAFDTDATDKANKVWDKVFANLSDFGYTFAYDGNSVPNPYGPIVFNISPLALLEAGDVAICLRSAGAAGFDRAAECLGSVTDVNRVFLYPVEEEGSKSSRVKFSDRLAQEFGVPDARGPELSCTIANGYLPISFVNRVLTDPYVLGGKSLLRWLPDAKAFGQPALRCYERFCSPSRKPIYSEIAGFILKGISGLSDFANEEDATPELKEWALGASQLDLDWQFKRFARYLLEGTLRPILGQSGELI